jgi:histidinol-phosphate aminotransferase
LLLSLADIRKLASEHPNATIVIDEAYIDFAQAGATVSAVSLINELDNVLVTQTFSKSRSLAGLRVGMAFGNPSLVEALTRMKNSFNSYPLDKLAQAGARASVLDTEYFEQTCQQVIDLRHSLTAELKALGFEVLPSQANFVFARPHDGDAIGIASALREQGIIVRHFDTPRIQEYLRITVGTAEQHQRLITALKELAAQYCKQVAYFI